MQMVPTHGGLQLDNECIVQAIRTRALLPVDLDAADCRQCGITLTQHQTLHVESCDRIKTVVRTSRHNAIRDHINFEWNRAGVDKHSSTEPLLNAKPLKPVYADLLLFGGTGQVAVVGYVDIRVSTVGSIKNIAKANTLVAKEDASETPSQFALRGLTAVLDRQAGLKHTHYQGLRDDGLTSKHVAPFIMSSTGSFRNDAWQMIKLNLSAQARIRLKQKMCKSLLMAKATLKRVYDT
jgi:hypothetical protein